MFLPSLRLPAAVSAAVCLLLVACGDDGPSAAERESAAEAERSRKNLEEALAELDAAKKSLEEAEKALDGAPTPEDEAKAKADLDTAKKQLDDAKKELEGQAQMGPYMAAISVPTGDTYATYTAVSPKIDGAITQQFLKRGLESAGFLAPSSYDGSIFVPGGSTPKVTKYSVDDQGRMVEGDTINFLGMGLETVDQGPIIGETMISPTKAYAIDGKNRRIVVWNPSTMELTGKVIDFSEAVKKPIEGHPEYALQLFHSAGFVKTRGNRTFMPIRWTNWDAETPDKILWRSAGLLVFDNEKDEFVHLLQDERLIDSIYTVISDAGDLYLFTGAYGASFNKVFGYDTPSGALKIKKGEDTFDPEYYLNLEPLVGNRPVTSPTGGRGTEIYIKAYYDERSDIYDDQGKVKAEILKEPWRVIRTSAWRYWKLDLEGKSEPHEIEQLPWGATDGYFFEIPEEDRLFLAVIEGMTFNFGNMTLWEQKGDTFVESITVPGALKTLGRLHRKR